MAPRKKVNLSCKTPATEESCARDCKYTYLPTSIMSDDIREQMKACVIRDLGLSQEKPKLTCDCKPIDGKCCSAISRCPTRLRQCACSDCKIGCDNNPWKTRSFAIQTNKLYLEKTAEKGWGLYALKDIKNREFIGEYTGILSNEVTNDADALDYQANLIDDDDLKVYIDGFEQGSAMRIVNHSCDNNTNSVPYAHDGIYKTVLIAKRNIKAGEEITNNYGWTFNRRVQKIYPCLCGSKACVHVMGRWDDEEDDRILLPDVFENITILASPAKLKQLNAHVKLNRLKLDHRELHTFTVEESVAVILFFDSQLRIEKARILECYMNSHKLFFYVVRVIKNESTVDYHVPMWFAFKYMEVAEVMLTKVFTDQERENIVDYHKTTLKLRTHRELKRNAEKYEGEILYTYVARLLKGEIPKFVESSRNIGGETSVRMESNYLEILVAPPKPSIPPPHSPMKLTTAHLSVQDAPLLQRKLAILKRLAGSSQVATDPASSQPENDHPLESPASSSSDVQTLPSPQSPATSNTEPFKAAHDRTGYTPTILANIQQEFDDLTGVDDDDEDQLFNDLVYGKHYVTQVWDWYTACKPPREIEPVIKNNKNVALYRRFFQHSVETLTFLTLWRTPTTVHSSFNRVYEEIEKDLFEYYYAQGIRDRRFLALEHYRLCCEIVQPGSFLQRYCSICGMTHNFQTLKEWNLHFHEYHEMVSPWYMCETCDPEFGSRWPSDFIDHVKKEHPNLLPLIRTDYENYELDPYADFTALRSDNHKLSHLLKPGQARITFDNGTKSKDDIPLVIFKPETRLPLDEKVQMIPTLFKVQHTHTDMSKNVEWNVKEELPLFYFKLSNMIKKKPILPASHVTVNKENEVDTSDDDFLEDMTVLTKPPKKLRGEYNKKVKENKKDSSTKSSENLLVDNQASKTKRKREMPEPTRASECQPSTSGSQPKKPTTSSKAKSKSRNKPVPKLSSEKVVKEKPQKSQKVKQPLTKKLKASSSTAVSSTQVFELPENSESDD